MPITKLPGLIDSHVHVGRMGGTHKEDFRTGTQAAVNGGIHFVIDMTNDPIPTVTVERLEEKIKLADKLAVCGIGFNYGTNGKNLDTFAEAAQNPRVFGLKIYCNHTNGEILVDDPKKVEEIFKAWESPKPIVVHAEGKQLEIAIEFAKKYRRQLHHTHISLASEVDLIAQAKQEGLKISAGATPHHLFLKDVDREKLGPLGVMKPPLATQADQDALWEGIKDGTIDLIETDHAPHTWEEKEKGAFGIPGLETSLGLMGLAIHQGRITEHELIKLMYLNPKKIFNITYDTGTIEVDFTKSYTVDASKFASKAKFSPFNGWTLYGATIFRSK